jgi:hypothetical protein
MFFSFRVGVEAKHLTDTESTGRFIDTFYRRAHKQDVKFRSYLSSLRNL